MPPYTLHGRAPDSVVAPASAEELAEALALASARGAAVVPWGGGTRQHIGAPPERYDLALSTARLSRVVEYSPEDLVITVEAGATLAAVQAELARHGQWLPWDPPCPAAASVGGLLASAAAGPLRLGYGTPRDWTLGMRVALGDGRLVKSGAKVVKNVAGYDAHKLQIGAFGTLGVIVEVTFKVAPLPESRQTLLVAFTEPRGSIRAIEQLRAAPLQPIALVALNPLAEQAIAPLHAFRADQPAHILVAARYAGSSGAVGRQMREAARRCVEVGARTIELSAADDDPLWAALADFTAPAADGSLLLRAGAPTPAMAELTRLMEQTPRGRGWPAAQLAVAGVGLSYSRWQLAGAAAADVEAALAGLRAGLAACDGYAVVEESPAALPRATIWGAPPPGHQLMRALRARWDQAGILNPGRFVVS